MKTIDFKDDGALADWLLTPEAVRSQAEVLYEQACKSKLEHFTLHEEKLDDVAAMVADLTLSTYPDLVVPPHARWRHFVFEGKDRWAPIAATITDKRERARIECELAIVSVLLDAGAGAAWQYRDAKTGLKYKRSEGLALASLDMFLAGAFRADQSRLPGTDLDGLSSFTAQKLAAGFQVDASNPLEGLDGRAKLIQRLASVMTKLPSVFGSTPRLGLIVDYLEGHSDRGKLDASVIAVTLLHALGHIWPDRPELAGRNLGDTWHHDAVPHGLIPFHKLSQWLTYSLFEPLERLGLTITNQDSLTGLSEYRNGGLFVDGGVIQQTASNTLTKVFKPADPVIIEWRALTVALIDRLAEKVRTRFDVSADALPLAAILQGGTWAAGRILANEKRAGGPPPITIMSDGSVF